MKKLTKEFTTEEILTEEILKEKVSRLKKSNLLLKKRLSRNEKRLERLSKKKEYQKRVFLKRISSLRDTIDEMKIKDIKKQKELEALRRDVFELEAYYEELLNIVDFIQTEDSVLVEPNTTIH